MQRNSKQGDDDDVCDLEANKCSTSTMNWKRNDNLPAFCKPHYGALFYFSISLHSHSLYATFAINFYVAFFFHDILQAINFQKKCTTLSTSTKVMIRRVKSVKFSMSADDAWIFFRVHNFNFLLQQLHTMHNCSREIKLSCASRSKRRE